MDSLSLVPFRILKHLGDHNQSIPITQIGEWINEAYLKDKQNSLPENRGNYNDIEEFNGDDVSYSIQRIEFDRDKYYKILKEHLNEEDIQKLEVITNSLEVFYHDDKLNMVLPLLKNIITQYESKIFFYSDNPINITEDYKILLPDFGNIELKLPDLTKAIYLFFCSYPNGVDIKRLEQHRDNIWYYYHRIASHADYDAMHKSLDELTSSNSKAIYTHISRIKKILYNLMDVIHAKSFIITSDKHGDTIKYIPIILGINRKSYTNKEDLDNEWGDVPF